MRLLSLISLIGLFLTLTGCSEDPPGLFPSDAAVEQYMDALMAGTYADWDLPDFGPDQIPALLGYAEDTTSVEAFPRNGISSFYQPECSLGMLALWTIESIRVRDLVASTPRGFGRFPSLNPVLALRASTELELVTGYDDQLGAARAYRNWWESRILLGSDFEKLRQIDPLAGTLWRWH
jgi:hypothetical protein